MRGHKAPRGVQDGWGQCKREAGTGDDARTIVRLDISAQQQIGKTTTVLGTRCFSGLTGSHGFTRFFGRDPSQGA